MSGPLTRRDSGSLRRPDTEVREHPEHETGKATPLGGGSVFAVHRVLLSRHTVSGEAFKR